MNVRVKLYELLLVGLAVLIAVGLVLYFSLRSSPALSEITWLPRWLADWADRNGNLRTGVPYLGASFLTCWCISLYQQLCPAVMISAGVRYFMHVVLGASVWFILLVLTEFMQLWMSKRWACWQDVFWGGCGILLGVLLWGCVAWLCVRLRCSTRAVILV